ncbi:unnamed protein product [Urochloa humidicola]
MDDEEAWLHFALLAATPGGPQEIDLGTMRRAVQSIADVGVDGFTIRRFSPESFLVIFSSQRERDTAMSTGSAAFPSAVPGCSSGHGHIHTSRPCRHRHPVLPRGRGNRGHPCHAWGWRTARKILASSCWIERLDPASADRSDMSMLKLTAWTDNPSRIPCTKTLVIAEHEQPIAYADPDMQLIFGRLQPFPCQKNFHSNRVLVHLWHVADFRPRSPSPPPGPHSRRQVMATLGTMVTRIGGTASPEVSALACRGTTARLASRTGTLTTPQNIFRHGRMTLCRRGSTARYCFLPLQIGD